MSPEDRDAISKVRRELETAAGAVGILAPAIERALNGLGTGIEGPSEKARNHRADHRRGRLSLIDSDPALNAFVRARIDAMTFAEIEADIAAHFPPGRRVSLSSIHRWWQRTGKSRG